MTLQRKFAGLLALLALTVAVNIGTAVWSVYFLERELAFPLASIEEVLGGITRLKVDLRNHAEAIDPPPGQTPPAPAEAHRTLAAAAERRLSELEASGSYLVRSGISTTRNLRTRVERIVALSRRWVEGDADAPAELLVEHRRARALIESMQNQILEDAHLAVRNGRVMRRWALFVPVPSVAALVLACVLGMSFMHRWVTRPVRRLRRAAEHIGMGDFSYRVPIDAQDEMGQLSAEVNRMAETIARMQEERVERERLAAVGEMIRRIAHNLRNALGGIRGLAEVTLAGVPSNSPEGDAQARIIRSLDRFEGWLAWLLRASSPLDVRPEPGAVEPWLRSLVETHRSSAEARGVALRLDTSAGPDTAAFDPRHLEQALAALLDNAIDASPRGGAVEIRAARSADGSGWSIDVRDEGPGIPPENREMIFRPYYTTKRGGTGIGLAVARRIVEQHGGTIRVGSGAEDGQVPRDRGPGAVFTVNLPTALDSSAAARSGQGAGSGGEHSHHRG